MIELLKIINSSQIILLKNTLNVYYIVYVYMYVLVYILTYLYIINIFVSVCIQ